MTLRVAAASLMTLRVAAASLPYGRLREAAIGAALMSRYACDDSYESAFLGL